MKYLFIAFLFLPLLLSGQSRSLFFKEKSSATVPMGEGWAIYNLDRCDSVFIYVGKIADTSTFVAIIRGVPSASNWYEAIDRLGRPFMVGEMPVGFRPGITLGFHPHNPVGIAVIIGDVK